MKITILLLLNLLNVWWVSAQWMTLTSGTTKDLNEVFFPVQDTGYVVGAQGTMLKTTNGGINWIALNTGFSKSLNELYFISTKIGWVVGDSGMVGRTNDGGMTWNFVQADTLDLHSVFAWDNNHVWIGGNNYLAKSTNGGMTWQKALSVENYIWDEDFKKIGMTSLTVGYAINRGYVLKTIDGGNNWKITDTASVHNGYMFHVLEDLAFFPNNDTLYACGWYGAYLGKTTNGGSQWQHDNSYQNYNLDFINTKIGYVGGWCQIHKTTDGGSTFIDASGGNSSLFCNIHSIDFTDEWTGYACGDAGQIIKTSNGGATSIQKDNINPRTVQVFPNPAQTEVQFSELVHVKVIDMNGKTLLQAQNTHKLNLASLPSGVYFLTLLNTQNQVVQRTSLVKE